MDKNKKSLCSFGHQFHKECIDNWIKEHQTCPICRSNLFIEGIYFEAPESYFKYMHKNKNKRQYIDREDMIIGLYFEHEDDDITVNIGAIECNQEMILGMIEKYSAIPEFPPDIMDTYNFYLRRRNDQLNAICYILGFINDGINPLRNDLISHEPIMKKVYFNKYVWSRINPRIKKIFLSNFEKIFIISDVEVDSENDEDDDDDEDDEDDDEDDDEVWLLL
jgi:hypothetical protein